MNSQVGGRLRVHPLLKAEWRCDHLMKRTRWIQTA